MSTATQSFLDARAFLLKHRDDHDAAAAFRWPVFDRFNWALDWFDHYANGNKQIALHVTNGTTETRLAYEELADRTTRIAAFFAKQGLERGDRVLIMLGNDIALWESVLACQKMGAVVVPASTQATATDLADRIARGNIKMAIADVEQAAKIDRLPEAQNLLRVLEDHGRDDHPFDNWMSFNDGRGHARRVPAGETKATDPFLLYFTSGTTARPKLVMHTHQSYPVGHLSTMYWIGITPGSIHQNISSPGWAKHAWSSFFAPWNAGATAFVHDPGRFQPAQTIAMLNQHGVESLCAPPTVWRMLILGDLGPRPTKLKELVSAGEPLNPEVIEHVRSKWGLTIRDGYGQTETTAQIGNVPGRNIVLGAMGRPLPGYEIALLDTRGQEANEGELAIKLARRPLGLMTGYIDDPARTEQAMAGGYYRTGDEARRDPDGTYHFVGRADDVFKSSDYRISPFELESVLLEHEAVAESAVIPSPDPVRLSVPKAIIALKPGIAPSPAVARSIFALVQEKLAPYKQVRRIEFGTLPKTISGKIRRVALREAEVALRKGGGRGPHEHWLGD